MRLTFTPFLIPKARTSLFRAIHYTAPVRETFTFFFNPLVALPRARFTHLLLARMYATPPIPCSYI